MKVTAFMINLLLYITPIHAQDNDSTCMNQPGEDIQVSLITCAPGSDLYAMFGHTGIHVNDNKNHIDLVFNYGMFNYKSENFIYKFVKGETYYELGAEPAYYFFERYDDRKISITEQVLNLMPDEKIRIEELLFENLKPENRVYKYNWLYDNCSTRARDMIEKAINGNISYSNPKTAYPTTRSILRKYTSVNDWARFGIDMVLGEEIDHPATNRGLMFIPAILKEEIKDAVVINNDGSKRELITAEFNPIKHKETKTEDRSHASLMCMTGLLFIIIGLTFFEIKRKKTFKWLDVTLAFIIGLTGVLISFLFFFSDHAGVSTNYNVILFNPLAFIAIPFIIKRKTKVLSYVILADILLYILTIVVIGQEINMAIYPLVSILLIRVIVNLIFFSYLCKTK